MQRNPIIYSADCRGALLPWQLWSLSVWVNWHIFWCTYVSHKDLCSRQLPVIYSLTWLSPAILSVFCYLTILSSSLDLHKTSASHQPPGRRTPCTSARKASSPPPSTSPGKRLHTLVLNSKVFLNRVQFLYFISLNTHSFVYVSD